MKSKGLRLSIALLTAWMQTGLFANAETVTTKCNSDCAQSKNTWLPRSFSSYSYHDLLQRNSVCKEDDHKLNFTFFTDYMQNFGNCKPGCKSLGSLPFWSGDTTLTIGNNDGRAQFDAYQLGFGNVNTDADGVSAVIQLNPRVQHIGTDMMMMYQHSKDERGLYFKLHAPLTAMTVQPRLKEVRSLDVKDELSFTQTTTGSSAITYEFLAYPTPLARPDSISSAFFGGTFDKNKLDGNLPWPIRLRKGRIAPAKHVAIRLADITTALGYNVFVNEKGYVRVGFFSSCPTGNVPTADYMLEPIVGRAGAWGVGGEVSSSYQVWENKAGDKRFTVSLQGEVLHLMRGRTPNYRSFDLKKNGPGSKYMLVQEYVPTYQAISGAAVNAEIYAPSSVLHPAVNLTTLPVLSKINVEGSVAVMLNFASDNWNASLGGEFWGRSKEKLCIDTASAVDQRIPNLNNYAVLGRQVSSYRIQGQGNLDAFLCEPEAKINKSQDPVILSGTLGTLTVPTTLPEGIKDARIAANRIPDALDEALDIAGAAAARAYTGKIFGQVGYTWSECAHMPSLALVGGAEFTNKTNSAVQLWNVGLQGSLNF